MALVLLLYQLSTEGLARTDTAVRSAFAFLYALPLDTHAAEMGSWVVDSAATTVDPDASGVWRIVVTQLGDTGSGLKLSELVGDSGTSPAQLAAAVAAMQKLEGKISKAEAEASITVTITLNPDATPRAAPGGAPEIKLSIPGALTAVRTAGHATRLVDRELEVDYERWSPATLDVRFNNVAVTAVGNEKMLDRVVKETRWEMLAGLKPRRPEY
jgi:hypothetical protein